MKNAERISFEKAVSSYATAAIDLCEAWNKWQDANPKAEELQAADTHYPHSESLEDVISKLLTWKESFTKTPVIPKGFTKYHTGGGCTALVKCFKSSTGEGERRWIVLTDDDATANFTDDCWIVGFYDNDEWLFENSASWESKNGHDLNSVLRMAETLATADGWIHDPTYVL